MTPTRKTALVTGAAGFTAAYLIPLLKQRGYEVIGLVEGAAGSPEVLSCDLTDQQATLEAVNRIQPSVAVHLAAVSYVGHKNVEEFYRVNVLGTLNLLEALAQLQAPPSKVIVASSANVYGNPKISLVAEDVCPAPVNHYGCSKLAMEHMVATWFERLPIIITRPFNYTGPGQSDRFVIPKIANHFAAKASEIELGNLDVSRDFSDVRDVAGAYAALVDSAAHSEIVNICSGKAIPLHDVISMLSTLSGHSLKVKVREDLVRGTDIRQLAGDNRKLKRLAGFTPATPFLDTLTQMYNAAANSK